MITYIATNNNQGTYVQANSLLEAQTYILDKFGPSWTVQQASPEEQIPEPTIEELLQRDLDFGQFMIKEFLRDEKSQTRTPVESGAIGAKLFDTQYMLNNGAILAAKATLESVVVDSLFTQQMKDKYLTMINQYLGI